jgi:hypothetical protein
MAKIFALLIVILIANSAIAFTDHATMEEVALEDFTDSGVGCIDDCLTPAN